MTEDAEPIDGDEAPDYAHILDRPPALRAFILKHYGAGAHEIDATIFVKNCELVFKWITNGDVPAASRKKNLEVVAAKS